MKLRDAKKILSGEWVRERPAGGCFMHDTKNGNEVFFEFTMKDVQFMLRQLALKTEREAKARE